LVDPWTRRPGKIRKRLVFFFKCDFSPSQRAFFYIFFSWLLTLLKVYYINNRRMFYFFNMRFEAFYYIYTLCSQEKRLFFQYGIWSTLIYIYIYIYMYIYICICIYIYMYIYSMFTIKKSYVFLMWDKKTFWNNFLNFIIYDMHSLYSHELFFNFFI